MSTSCGSERSRSERAQICEAVYPVIRHSSSFTRSNRPPMSTSAIPIGACVNAVSKALRRLLWPLAPGGPDGKGWPLGRAVRSRELEVEISRVAGVLEVTGINLFERAAFADGANWRALVPNPADSTQALPLAAWQLPELLSVVVAEGPGAPDSLNAAPNPFAAANAVAVPVVPKVC